MLIDEQYPNIFSLFGETHECFLNLTRLSLLIDDQEVPLGIWSLGDMTNAGQQKACDRAVYVSGERHKAGVQSC